MKKVGDYIINKIRERSQAQGHTLTGAFEEGLSSEVRQEGGNTVIVGIDGTGVGKFIDVYTPASKIKTMFSPGSGKKHSNFIEGLERYAQLRFGLSGKEALGAAFAMAHTMRKEGKSTQNSKKHSKNGKRDEVITGVLRDEKENIKRMIFEELRTDLKIQFTNLIRKETATWQ